MRYHPPAAPTITSTGPTLEANDPRLSFALFSLALFPTAERHRAVAGEYLRLGILDAAHEHFTSALAIDPRDAAAYDGRARIWRDSGVLPLALADAHRAVYHAPRRVAGLNTLGTVLQALGLRQAARQAYRHALVEDPGAAYVWNNLCYLSFLEGQAPQALGECQTALRLDPTLTASRHNIALALAAVGLEGPAEAELARTGGANAHYNIGILRLARQDYSSAAEAFDAASRAAPSMRLARSRAAQARRLGARDKETR